MCAACFVVLLAVGAQASAHQGNPDFRSELSGVNPAGLGEGLQFSVGNYDDFIALSNRSGKTVEVAGYRGEPYLRFLPDGKVEGNVRSPAWFLNRDRYGEGKVPAGADADLRPVWKVVSDESRFAWHDHRAHWMGKGIPPQVVDRGVRTEVFEYSIPIRIDGQSAELTGSLYWVGSRQGVPIWPFALLGLGVIGGAVFLFFRRRRAGRGAISTKSTQSGGPR